MIPQRVQRLFDFIDYLNENKNEYKKYISLSNELTELNIQRNLLNPDGNYKDKLLYDNVQRQIEKKLKPIIEHIHDPITKKILELEVWSGDRAYASIWNNSISEIYDFRNSFSEDDIEKVLKYKHMYLSFRTEINTDFISLFFIFHGLDSVLKVLFEFFKDAEENEFENFETKKVNVRSIKEAVDLALKSGKSVSFTLPNETILPRSKSTRSDDPSRASYNTIFMRDNIEIGNISNENGQVNIGSNIKTDVDKKDELAERTFNWQKWGTIVATIISIVGIIVAIVFS